MAKSSFDFAWQSAFSVGVEEIDSQHRRLFALVGELDAAIKDPESCPDSGALIAGLSDFAAQHFATEEQRMREAGYPELAAHAREHASLTRELAAFRKRFDCGDEQGLADLDDFLKDWALRHTLLVDRQYIPSLSGGDVRDRP